MKNMKIIFGILAIVVLGACNTKEADKNYRLNEVSAYLNEPPPLEEEVKFSTPEVVADEGVKSNVEKAQGTSLINKKKIIKDGSISIKTSDVSVAKKNIDELLKKYNSYYDSEDFNNDDKESSYDLKIRIPADNFEKIISSLESGKDEIIGKSIKSRDVTEEYIDIEARLKNKKDYFKRYKDILSGAKKVTDILEIEEKIRALQEEIESAEGRLKYLNDQVTYSTLDIHLFKEKEYTYKPLQQDKFSERVKKSLSKGWASVVDFILWLIKWWPIIILSLGIIVVFRIIRKRRNNI